MKYIRTYEDNSEPQIGDYIICKPLHFKNLIDYLPTQIGKVYSLPDTPGNHGFYYVLYKNTPKEQAITFMRLKDKDIPTEIEGLMHIRKSEILFHSKNKKDCEMYLASKKYNL